MKKIKVLQIIPSFNVGGAEGLVLTYLRNYDKECMDMKAISLYPSGNTIYNKIIEDEELPVIYLNKKGPFDLFFIKRLSEEIKKFNPDVVHTHMSVLKYVIMAGWGKRPIFHTIHSEVLRDAGFYDRHLNRYLFKKYKVTPIALQEGLKEEVNRYYKCMNTEVVYNGIDVEKFQNGTDIRRELGISSDAFVICHVGSFSYPKNHIFLIKLFEEFLKYRQDSCLILVGSGELESEIKDMVRFIGLESKVLFLGNRSDIANILKSSNVFVFPSLYEGFGIAVIEAVAAGIPAIVSDRVPDEICVVDDMQRLSLEEPIATWCKVIIDMMDKKRRHSVIEKYDIRNILKTLYSVYSRKVN